MVHFKTCLIIYLGSTATQKLQPKNVLSLPKKVICLLDPDSVALHMEQQPDQSVSCPFNQGFSFLSSELLLEGKQLLTGWELFYHKIHSVCLVLLSSHLYDLIWSSWQLYYRDRAGIINKWDNCPLLFMWLTQIMPQISSWAGT